MVNVGDRLILASYVTLSDAEAKQHRPRVVLVGENNEVREVKDREEARVRYDSETTVPTPSVS